MVKMPADSSTITKCHMAWLGPSVEEIDPNIHRFPPGKWRTNTGSPTWNSLCLAQTCCSFWDCCLSCALIEIAGLRRCRCDDRIHPSRSSAGVTPVVCGTQWYAQRKQATQVAIVWCSPCVLEQLYSPFCEPAGCWVVWSWVQTWNTVSPQMLWTQH